MEPPRFSVSSACTSFTTESGCYRGRRLSTVETRRLRAENKRLRERFGFASDGEAARTCSTCADEFKRLLAHRLLLLNDQLVADFSNALGDAHTGFVSADDKEFAQSLEIEEDHPSLLIEPTTIGAPCNHIGSCTAIAKDCHGYGQLRPSMRTIASADDSYAVAPQASIAVSSMAGDPDTPCTKPVLSFASITTSAPVSDEEQAEVEAFRQRYLAFRQNSVTLSCMANVASNSSDTPDHDAFSGDLIYYDDVELRILLRLRRTKTGKWAAFMIDVLDGIITRSDDTMEICYPWSCIVAQTNGSSTRLSSTFRAKASDGSVSDSLVSYLNYTRCQRMVLKPNSKQRLGWIILGAILVVSDVIIIPMRISGMFDGGGGIDFLDTFNQVALLYWICDIVFQFFVGFHKNGMVVVSLPKIAQEYAKSWLAPDLLAVLIDLAILGVQTGFATEGDGAGMDAATLRFVRILRVLRLARLVRVAKLNANLKEGSDNFFVSEGVVLGMKLAEHLSAILIMNHYVACGWYAIAMWSNQPHTWIDGLNVDLSVWWHAYAYSMHWSLTQFTPSTNNIAPHNIAERVFAIFVVIFSVITFSSFVSGISNVVTQLRQRNLAKLTEGAKIRQFLTKRHVTTELASRILYFFNQNYHRTKQVREEDMYFFKQFPESMLIDLHTEIFMPVLFLNPVFRRFRRHDLSILVVIAHSCMKESSCLPRQDVFITGQDAQKAHVFRAGELTYWHQGKNEQTTLNESTWFAELSLYVKWSYQGQLSATKVSDLVEVHAVGFQNIVGRHGGPFYMCMRKYVCFLIGFVENRYNKGISDLPSDLPLDTDMLLELASRADKVYRNTESSTLIAHTMGLSFSGSTLGGLGVGGRSSSNL